VKRAVTSMIATLSLRERRRDDYRQQRDPIREDRLLWWKQDFGHAVNLLNRQSRRGCGDGSRNIGYDILFGSRDPRRLLLSPAMAPPPLKL